MHAAAILTALADLAPAGAERVFDVSGTGRPLVWLPEPHRGPRGARLDRLAALDALHREERLLRRGLAFLVGGADVDGGRRRVRLPLLAQPVRLERGRRGYRVVPAGDLELTPLIADRDLAARLEAAPGLAGPGWLTAPGTTAWITTAAQAAGLKVAGVLARPPRSIDDEALTGVAAAALFVTRDVFAGRLRDTLLNWAGRPGLAETALSRLYLGTPQPPVRAGDDEDEVLSPLPLNAAQRDVVRRSRTEPVVVVSGAPGNGKSHALVAAALDTVDRGGSVLVATQSVHAAEVLGTLLRRHPGPAPVLFGDAERREAVAAELAAGAAAGVDAAQLRTDAAAVSAARHRVAATRAGIAAALDQERRAAALPDWQPLLPALSHDAPGLFEPDADLTAIRGALADADPDSANAGPGGAGWWRRLRRSSALRRLRRLTGAAAGVPSIGCRRRCRPPRRSGRRRDHPRSTARNWPPPGGRWPRRTPRSPKRSARPCGTRPPAPVGGPQPPGAPPAGSAPRCGPAGTDAGNYSPGWTPTPWCGPCRSGWARWPTSKTCCPRWPACSTWWCSTKQRTSTSCGPPRCWPGPGVR
ncbi:hypothetical protein QQG74_19175 [Micromonospora sp. FIMYZ51]|uniref:hypothetical protein n=1 Tax=Micromonospora sp. FIMYZ51 TaxID=3051832 RepID=UPI00311D5398